MSTAVKRLYEGLFLVNSNDAASDWQGVIGAIEKILERSESEVVSLKKWDDRKLCYELHGADRGTYILVYFNVDPLKIRNIERDVHLSELVMRVMILKTDKMSKDDMAKDTPLDAVAKAEAEAAQAAEAKAAENQARAEAAAEAKAQAEAEQAPEADSGDSESKPEEAGDDKQE